MIEIRHLKKEFETVTPLSDINAVINDGDVVAVIGPSGCGKSTLIRCINLLEKPTSGQIIINGNDITASSDSHDLMRRKVGMVFQSFNLFSHMTVIENVMLAPVEILKKPNAEAYEKAMTLLRRVGLAERALDYPDMLSGGQKQRVAIARTLAMDPEVILFDEPTSALDPTMVGEVESVIHGLKDDGRTMLIVTHDMNFAEQIANRVFYLDEGIIYEEGNPKDLFGSPEKPKTKAFVNKLRQIGIDITSRDHDFLTDRTLIDSFCAKNRISTELSGKIALVFEELTQQILIPEYDDPDIKIVITFSQKYGSAGISAVYKGKCLSPKDSKNDLSYRLIENYCSDIRFSYEPETETNSLELDVKK